MSDFRNIVINGDTEKADRLFRAAVSAFCSLVRPSRREIAQLEDLALPLFGTVSVESKRYVAAALSECANPPPALVLRLANESVDIAAPLLIRSTALNNIDLISLIGRHGLAHARAIARRPGLDRTIADLARALAAASSSTLSYETPQAAEKTANDDRGPSEVERTRARLRALMRTTEPLPTGQDATLYGRLLDAALEGNRDAAQSLLSGELNISQTLARAVIDGDMADLVAGLAALQLAVSQAFLIATLLCPELVRGIAATRAFLDQYQRSGPEAARLWLSERDSEIPRVVPLRTTR
ncbi:DUF2336 domain-containing protein [Mesorhizobium sp. NBSH29]|uniref:hypothetical protein n=1 Tax=Mesorhizobium sp. NBSH29 TaxID=2654249 RepID=UPI0018968614|nr:hypothetical protein [Mesorhizobium sp. NBSH29]QPC87191.1 DUF2336 domain-containing protein [Mesorhizobium sp. NBSH29]